MFVRYIVLFFSLILPELAFSQESPDQQAALRNALAKEISQIDLAALTSSDAVTLCISCSKAFHETGMPERAADYFQRAMKAARGVNPPKHQFVLFDLAILLGDFKTAAEIAETSTQNTRFFDKLAIEKYRRGDDKALEGFPQSKLDFYLALDLADAYAKREEYEKLELFVTDINSLPSNEPTDVGAIIWSRIAEDFRKQGKIGEAKKFIDKAAEIGGNNFYTGYGVRVTSLSIHGALAGEAEKYAQRAVAYRGHHTRELLSNLINELVIAGYYKLAKKTLDYYPTTKDRMSGERYLAYHLAQQEQFDDAIDMARGIADKSTSASARMYVGGELLLADQRERREQGKTLILEAESLLVELADEAREYSWQQVIGLLVKIDHEKALKVVKAAKLPLDRGRRAAAAIAAIGPLTDAK